MSAEQRLLLAFDGETVPVEIKRRLRESPPAGFTLFHAVNVVDSEQVIRLTRDLQAAAAPGKPMLIAVDQEGGQLNALGGAATAFPGNMALGAVADPVLTEQVGAAMGREMRALGVNVDYAPVCDIATNLDNPSLGIRSFGQDPSLVAQLTPAMVRGLQAQGVAATLKHFPGKGAATVDPHHQLPVLPHDVRRLEAVEFAPFQAGIEAGAKMLMVGHYALPAITGELDLPSSMSHEIVTGLARNRLGFAGTIVTDALDMGALRKDMGETVAHTLEAGVDLLLCTPDLALQDEVRQAVRTASVDQAVPLARLDELRSWLAAFPIPDVSVVGCAEHRALALEVARRAITLVRDEADILPLQLSADARILAIMPEPTDLTPADTSSNISPGLAPALRRYHRHVEESVISREPRPGAMARLVDYASAFDLVVVGTINADAGQAGLVDRLVEAGIPVLAVALRDPHDLARYPQAPTYLCTYGILPVSLEAFADAIFGRVSIGGRLPTDIPGLYRAGHGLTRGVS